MHVAITGASSGIGEALAREYAKADNTLTIVARRQSQLEALRDSLPCPTQVCLADLSSLETCCGWVADAESAHGPIDLLINNAGIQYVEPALGVTDARGEKLLALNLLVPIRLVNRVAPGMVQRGHGAIVNVASMAAITATPGMAYYCASKSGLASYSEVLRHELRHTGVHVLTVYPGPVATPMERAARDNLQESWVAKNAPTGSPEVLAQRIRRCVESRKPHLYYPGVYGLARYFRVISQWLTERMTPEVRSKA